jgi:hypothetical protein
MDCPLCVSVVVSGNNLKTAKVNIGGDSKLLLVAITKCVRTCSCHYFLVIRCVQSRHDTANRL